MSQVLYINACVRPASRTAALAEYVLEKLGAGASGNGANNAERGVSLQQLRLEKEQPFPLSRRRLAFRDESLAKGDTSNNIFRYAKQFATADTIVIAAPYWDLLFPASLRMYLENVCVIGVTFRYDERGIPQTLCRAKKLIYVSTAGGTVGTGITSGDNAATASATEPCDTRHLGFVYVKTLMQSFFHIDDCQLFCAENLDVAGADVEAILAQTRAHIDRAFA